MLRIMVVQDVLIMFQAAELQWPFQYLKTIQLLSLSLYSFTYLVGYSAEIGLSD